MRKEQNVSSSASAPELDRLPGGGVATHAARQEAAPGHRPPSRRLRGRTGRTWQRPEHRTPTSEGCGAEAEGRAEHTRRENETGLRLAAGRHRRVWGKALVWTQGGRRSLTR